jgi:nicotinamidase-related amidase
MNEHVARWQGGSDDLVAACHEAGGVSDAIVRRLPPRPHDEHVLKPKHSGFLATPLPILLDKLGVRRRVLTGVSADSCVLATAQDANMREFALWVPQDAVAAISPAQRRTALALLAQTLGASVRPVRALEGVFPGAS